MAITAEHSGTANTSGTHGDSLLLVDDDPEIREELKSYLSANGMTVMEAGDAETALKIFSEHRFDLIVLDLLLGADNGFDVLREIRQTHTTPCIMVTGQGEPTDKVVGLELGADDYVVKPVNLRELLARIRALLRRSGSSGGSSNRKGGPVSEEQSDAVARWKFDPHRRRLSTPDGSLVPLTTAECDLLIELVAHEGDPQTREELCRRVFNRQWQPYDRSLDSIVVKLRRKLEPNPDHPMVIKTIRGKGYLFTGFPSGD
ncbi:response regulator transcription factor [Parvibaculum sp.]|uniref:response regulator transcription factor n=1 Tax=Parvibaculum sp. TaxID=2024848 RepID=UPI0032EFAF6E